MFNKGDKIVFRDWTNFFIGKVLYSAPKKEGVNENQFHIDSFQKNVGDEYLEQYVKPALFLKPDESFPYLWRNFGFGFEPKEPNYLIVAIERTQKSLLEGLYKGNSDINCHACMPFSGFKAQFLVNKSLLPSNSSFQLLSKIYDQKVEDLVKYSGYNRMPIPPLVTILLSQCNDLSDIPIKLKQLREDFTELRNSFSTLEKRIDEANKITDQIEAINELRDFWKSFMKKYGSENSRLLHHFWDVKNASGLEEAAENILDGGEVEDFLSNLNTVAISGKIAGKAMSYFKDKKSLNRFQGMVDLWNLTQKSPVLKQQAKDYERIFGVKIDLKELNKLYETSWK